MIVRTRIGRRTVEAAMRTEKVRKELKRKADGAARDARAVAAAEGVDMQVDRYGGTRPKGRPYERVESPDGAGQEWGTARRPRRRVLGRVAERS